MLLAAWSNLSSGHGFLQVLRYNESVHNVHVRSVEAELVEDEIWKKGNEHQDMLPCRMERNNFKKSLPEPNKSAKST